LGAIEPATTQIQKNNGHNIEGNRFEGNKNGRRLLQPKIPRRAGKWKGNRVSLRKKAATELWQEEGDR